MTRHVSRYLLVLPVVVLVAAVLAAGRASGQAGHHGAPVRTGIVASPCGDRGTIAASALRVPVGSCDLAGRTVTYRSARVVVPAPGKRACGLSVVKTTRYTVCAIDDGAVYAITGQVSLPAACLQTGSIAASLLRTPVRDTLCDLRGRLVRFDEVGVHVPRTGGTVCVDADGTTGSESLCVTRDSTAVFAVATRS